jgi:ribosome-associated protein
MPEAIRVTSNVLVPAAALSLRTARASGPGGQNVNKVASKVELRLNPSAIEGLPADARARLESLAANRRDADGRVVVTSQRTRDQSRNLEDAREKLRRLVERCLERPRARRPTQVTRAARERRLAAKKRAGGRKRGRERVRAEEE